MYIVTSSSPEHTFSLGFHVGTFVHPGDILCLIGHLGAGKTLFVKGIAKALSVNSEQVTSPTFTLINEYAGDYLLYHFDVYRLENPEELEDLGYEEYFYGDGICIIEWGDRVTSYLPQEYLQIGIDKIDETTREIRFTPYGSHYQQLVERIRSEES